MQEQAQYFASDANFADETVRLRYLEQEDDPTTTGVLERLGVAEGWRCLEVGAGGGSVVRWLATRVGPAGSVTAADTDLRYLGDLPANATARQHDVVAEAFEPGAYDLAHCRNLLVHLRDPQLAVQRMNDALRPGGWCVVEERDVSSFAALRSEHPLAHDFDCALRTGNEFLRSSRTIDAYLGRQLPDLLVAAGLVNVGNQAMSKIVRGGEPRAIFLKSTSGLLSSLFLERGVLTEPQIAARDEACLDPSFCFFTDTLVSAWGQCSDERT